MKYLNLGSFLSFILFLTSCVEKKTETTEQKPNVENESKLVIGYNENIETLALIYNLSESGDYHFNEIKGPRGILAKELTMQYEEFSKHEAVIKLNNLLNDGMVDLYDIILSMYNTKLPEFKQFAKYPSIYYENEGLTAEETQARFDDFNESVIKFYTEAGLKNAFEQDYKNLYQKLMSEVLTVAPTEKFIEEAEAYYGIKRNAYEIIVSAFAFNGIGKAMLINDNGKTKAISLVTSNHILESDTINLNDLNSFKIGYNDIKYFQEIGLHELIHTFFHEALKENNENIALVNDLAYLFTDSLKKDMMNQGYIDWRTCFEEHLVRIGEVKISERLGDQKFVDEYRKECINDRRFIYFKIIENIFIDYEKNRTKYKNIEDFIPVLAQELKTKLPKQSI